MTTGQLIDLYHRERLNDQHVMLQQYQACGEINQIILKAISFHENNSRIIFFTFFPFLLGESPPYGTLCVRVYYRNECLFVEIINARYSIFIVTVSSLLIQLKLVYGLIGQMPNILLKIMCRNN